MKKKKSQPAEQPIQPEVKQEPASVYAYEMKFATIDSELILAAWAGFFKRLPKLTAEERALFNATIKLLQSCSWKAVS